MIMTSGLRTDCKIDNRAVYCRNATTLGFAKSKAKRGDLIRTEHGVGRSLGRLTDSKGIVYILVMQLSPTLTSCYERWVIPAKVLEIRDNPAELMAWFFQASLPYSVDTMRHLMNYGTCSQSYVANIADRAAQFINRQNPAVMESRK